MAITRWQTLSPNAWSPFRRLTLLRDEIDRLFDSPLAALTTSSHHFLNGWVPALDLYNDGDQLVVRVELPGMKKEEIDIALHGEVLTISGERKEENNLAKAETYRAERILGRFQRTLTLPVPVDSRKVEASYSDGILTVRLPKAEEAKPKRIDVKVC